jgi:hypothetical protein
MGTDNRDELRNSLDEYLNGLRICDYITRDEQERVLDDFDTWCKTTKIGDTYFYDEQQYTLAESHDDSDEEDD